MRDIKIAVSGLDGLTEAMLRLAIAIENQKAVVVPEGTKPANQEFKHVEPTKEPKEEKTDQALPKITLEMVRQKFTELARAGKRDALRSLLADFGVENVSALEDLDNNPLGAVYERLEAM